MINFWIGFFIGGVIGFFLALLQLVYEMLTKDLAIAFVMKHDDGKISHEIVGRKGKLFTKQMIDNVKSKWGD